MSSITYETTEVISRRGRINQGSVARARTIDGSKFKAANNRDKHFTQAKSKGRLRQVDESIERYVGQLASADRHPDELNGAKNERLETKTGSRAAPL